MKKIIMLFAGLLILLTGCSIGTKWNNPIPNDEFLIIGHRGASAYEPENTIPSFELAKNLGSDYIELDVHLTKDDKLVIMHDKDVKRTTESKGKIKNHTLAELKELTADEDKDGKVAASAQKEAYDIPTLQEVLAQMTDETRFVIELKDPDEYDGIEEKLVSMMNDYGLIEKDKKGYPKAVIHSFDEESLQKVHRLNKDIPLLQLISFDDGEEAKMTSKELTKLQTYAIGVGVSYEALNAEFVSAMHQANIIVFAYTVDDREDAVKLQAMGVNGIHTNKPDLLTGTE
ncbi:glycerophosphodiester phosphodiesterase [Sporosarcina sp. Sa2YVA2]|uniref:Glycerophosphodiester phosphodiesterase n=1 Tax=Sporosarcina quadrami TaxID=2762234 RepID=A0ABR8UB15_9BACL|nr:glycerophosphodiester phosphodiesterase family protein [Sporosarcina quadrami]MBD7985210.1 glycerophosphodiester phosphodiesterase [Sporosarcina quadrami]